MRNSKDHKSKVDWSEFAIPKQSIKASLSEMAALRVDTFYRDGFICQICKDPVNRSTRIAHHIIPKGRIRLDVLENLATMHFECHDKLHAGELDISVDDFIELKKDQLGEYYGYRKANRKI